MTWGKSLDGEEGFAVGGREILESMELHHGILKLIN